MGDYNPSPRGWLLSGAFALAVWFLPVSAQAQLLREASQIVHTGSSTGQSGGSSTVDSQGRSSTASVISQWNRRRGFLPFPYAWGGMGYEQPVSYANGRRRGFGTIASLDGGIGLLSVGRGGFGLRFLWVEHELELRYTAYVEPTDAQTFWVGLGRLRWALVIADSARIRGRLFIGGLHWFDQEGHRFGGEGGCGFDIFPRSPWTMSFDVSGGLVGKAGLVSLRGSLGYLVGAVEIQLGWQHESVIPTRSFGESVDISGPYLGLRLWR